MKKLILLILLFSSIGRLAWGQQYIQDLILEKYYITDSNDAADPFSAGLNESDTTYRVFIDMCEGCKLLGMFGNENHLFEISSTEPFYNNDLGQTFGHQIAQNFLNISTIGIDSYLSLGASSDSKLAILKSQDPDGSIWPNGTSTGLLVNDDPEAAIPLTEQDGLIGLPDTLTSTLPPGFTVQPLEQDAEAYVDAVFGTESDSSLFTSAYFESLTIRASQGMFGADESNRILLGQFTTSGELSFQFNLILFIPGEGQVRVVADEQNLQPGEVVSAFLKYPPECGCTDPNYIEFNPAAPCDDGSCQELIVFGCTDTLACNYSEDVNFNVESLCCYGIDDCGELDPLIACPTLGTEFENAQNLRVYPNPADHTLNIEISNDLRSEAGYLSLHNSSGNQAISMRIKAGEHRHTINTTKLSSGIYQLVLIYPDATITRKIIIQH